MTFEEFYVRACERHGEDVLREGMPSPKTPEVLSAQSDAFYLAEMTRKVFQSGFVWRVIEAKWDGFNAAFSKFDVDTVRRFDSQNVEQLMLDTRVVRHKKKIEATVHNAGFVSRVAEEHGSFGAYLAGWSASEFPGLFRELKSRGARLGGRTGQYFLRYVGWDAPLMTNDVVAALVEAKIVTKAPSSKSAWSAVQSAFDQWHAESGHSYAQISYLLSHSIDAN